MLSRNVMIYVILGTMGALILLLFENYFMYWKRIILRDKVSQEMMISCWSMIFDKYTMVLQLLGTSCWYHDNCVTKLWDLTSKFIYLYMVFNQHCFHLEQYCFYLDRQFSCSSNISNWLSRVPTQYSQVIQNSCSSWLSCTL